MSIGMDSFACSLQHELVEIRAERDRYRAALQAIAEPKYDDLGLTSHLPYALMKIAQRALGENDE